MSVGTENLVVVRFNNKFRDKKTKKYIPIKEFTAWIEWGGCSYRDASDRNPICYSDKSDLIPQPRTLLPLKKRKISLPFTYEQCLPPNGADPLQPATLDPSSRFFSGLPCASGKWIIQSKGYVKGYGWRSWSAPAGGELWVIPAAVVP